MDKDRFHNALALSLGYEVIMNSKGFSINVDDKAYPDVRIIVKFEECKITMIFNASEVVHFDSIGCCYETNEEIKIIIGAVHKAYIRSISNTF